MYGHLLLVVLGIAMCWAVVGKNCKLGNHFSEILRKEVVLFAHCLNSMSTDSCHFASQLLLYTPHGCGQLLPPATPTPLSSLAVLLHRCIWFEMHIFAEYYLVTFVAEVVPAAACAACMLE